MTQVTLQQVLKLAQQLPTDEQDQLVRQLKAPKIHRRPPLDLPVIDVGPWPDDMTLRREDWYGDDGR